MAYAGPPVAATPLPAFDIMSLFDKGRAERIIEEVGTRPFHRQVLPDLARSADGT